MVSRPPITVALLTDGGVTLLRQELWTLERKAAHFEALLTRHHRHSLVASCTLAARGALHSCNKSSGDNDGLWTSLAGAAEALRYGVTGQQDAKALALGFFSGLELLYNVTGRPGLMARTVNGPGEPYDRAHHDKTLWYNSSTLPGWVWKGDTSSDEVTGHMFGYALIRRLATEPGSEARQRVERVQLRVAEGIVANGLQLVDVTGKPTTWGKWDPPTLNSNRAFSDGRGVNSMQALAFIASANATASAKGDARLVKLMSDVYAALVTESSASCNLQPGADYLTNILNAKITSSCDDNYSDDELLMLPTYLHLAASPANTATPKLREGLRRNFDVELRDERSALWGAIFLAAGGARSASEHTAVVEDVLWSLRQWPLDLRSWHVDNRHRQDITWRIGADRFGRAGGRSTRVLPPNERMQYRWNADPYAVDDGHNCDPVGQACSDGLEEADPTAFLLPYWMARYHGLLGPPAAM